jgi:hypothetical protein
MPAVSQITDAELLDLKKQLSPKGERVRAWQIRDALNNKGISLDESTIRGRFLAMGQPLGKGVGGVKRNANGDKIDPNQPPPERSKPLELIKKDYTGQIPEDMKEFIPKAEEFVNYIERAVDKRLGVHYNAGKYPITQGKQGTGKTFSHSYYAYKEQLPFFLISCYEDLRLVKLFGDKTILNGSVVFQESLFVRAVQCPSVILFDEINAVSNNNTYDFHALLQNRELFVKDADNGKGKVYKLHPDCKIGFAQNPKSAKYMGGSIKASNFLGRCTFITYPEFTKADIRKAMKQRFPNIVELEIKKFAEFYFACIDTINKSDIPVDISIRQLINIIDLYNHGLPLKDAIEDGMTSIMDAVSQSANKDAFFRLAQTVWEEMMNKSIHENVGDLDG